ncbi:MAG: hypothetical protein U5K43_07775 [Halofilum sp. (in: g-proteobacteria)]|nr:hypothetical protein [Halofilum sp. (in: g-proteobacteria)]
MTPRTVLTRMFRELPEGAHEVRRRRPIRGPGRRLSSPRGSPGAWTR